MIAGALDIKIMGDMADLARSLTDSKRQVAGYVDYVRGAVGGLAGAFAALGVGLSISAFTGWIRGAIDTADALSDVTEQTGVAAQDLAGLALQFEKEGLGNDKMVALLSRFSSGIVEGNKALDALGVKSKNASGDFRDTRDVLGEVADKFQGLPDGVQKTALAVELFGKSGAELVPLLNGGSAGLQEMQEMAQKLGLVLDDQTVKAAGDFNDTLFLVQKGGQGVAQQIAAQMLPTLTSLAGSFLSTMTEGDRLRGVADFLATSMKLLYSVGLGVVQVFSTVGKTIGAAAGQIGAVLRGDFAGAAAIGREWADDVSAGWTATAKAVSAAWDDTGNASVAAAAKLVKPTKLIQDATKANAELKKELEAEAKILAELSGLTGTFAEDWDRLNRMYAKGKVTQEQLLQLQADLLAKQPAIKKAQDEEAKAVEETTKAFQALHAEELKRVEAYEKTVEAMFAGNEKLREEIELIGFSEEQQLRVVQSRNAVTIATKEGTLAELERQAAITGFMSREHIALAGEIEQLRERNELLGLQFDRKVTADAAKAATTEWTKFTDSVQDGLTDSLFRSFEAGKKFFGTFWSGIKNTFKTSVLKLLVQGVMSGVTGLVGSAASLLGGGGGEGGAGGLMGAANMASSAFSLITGAGSAFASGISSGLTGFFAGEGGAIIANGISSAVGASTVGGASFSVGSAIGAAAPYALAAVVALNALGVFRSEKKTDVGFKGTLGETSNVSGFTTIRKGGTLFSGPSYRDELAELPAATKTAFDQSVGSMFTSVKAFSDVLGLNASAIDGFTKDIFISTQGLTEAQIQEKLAATFKSLGDDLANLVAGGILTGAAAGSSAAAAAIAEDAAGALPQAYAGAADPAGSAQSVSAATALDPFRRAGESAIDTLGRLATSLSGVNQVFDTLDQKALQASLAGGAVASALVDLFGGMDKFGAAASSFLQDFYTPAERAAITTRQLTSEFDKLGVALPTSRAAYKDLVEVYQEKLDTEDGRRMYATLLQLGPVFASITEAADDAADSVASKAERDRAIADKTYDYEQQILRAEGKDREALDRDRAREYAAAAELSPALAALADELWHVKDDAEAAAAALQLANAARDQDIQIMELQGDAAGALAARRAIELAAMDPLLREKQKYIYSLQDEAAATAAAAAAKAEADARQRDIDDTQFDYEQRILRAQGKTREALDRERGKEWARLQALNPALAQLAVELWKTEDAANSAAEAEAARQKVIDLAYDALERAVAAQRATAQDALTAAQAAANGLRSVFDLLKTNVAELYAQVDATAAMSAAAGVAYIRNALATGNAGDQASLSKAIAAARSGIDANQYTSKTDFDRDRLVLAGQLAGLQGMTGEQLTVAEQQLQAAEAEIKRLDDLLKNAKTQLDALRGIDTSVMSVVDALEALHRAMFPSGAGGAAGSKPAGGAVVGAGPSGGASAGRPLLGKQADGSYEFSDGYINRTITGSEAARLTGMDSIYAMFANTGDVAGYYAAVRDAGFSLRDVAAHDGYFYGDVVNAAQQSGITPFANGGAFTNGVVTLPTMFNPAVMGEAGSEGILPLANIGGRLGVHASIGGGHNAELVGEIRGLRQQVAEGDRQRYAMSRELLVLTKSIDRIARKADKIGTPPVRQADQAETQEVAA